MPDSATTEYEAPRARLTGGERRRTILAAACGEFSRMGYHGASTASIARAAGCSEPMLYKHFAGKLALFLAALQESAERFQRSFGDERLVREGTMFEQGIEYIRFAMASPAFQQMVQLRKIAIMNADEPEVRATLELIEQRTAALTAEALERGIAEGIIRPDVDVDYVVLGWTGLLFASCYRDTLTPGSFSEQTRHVEQFMRSLCVDRDQGRAPAD